MILTSKQLIFLFQTNINNFVEQKSFADLISFFLEKEMIRLIASCQTVYFNSVESHLGEFFVNCKHLEIPPLSTEQKQFILSQINVNENLTQDDTIGSFFLILDGITKNYAELDPLNQEILRSYKCVEIWRRNNRGNKNVIKEYTEKRLLNYHRLPSDYSPAKCDAAFEKLDSLGIIKNLGEKIYIEPAYLDRIIAPDETEETIALEIVEYYPNVYATASPGEGFGGADQMAVHERAIGDHDHRRGHGAVA